MKKAWSIVLVFMLMVAALAGCQKIKDKTTDYKALVKETLAREYSFTADMRYGESSAAAEVKKTGASDVHIEFFAPETLGGLVITSQGDQIRVEYQGIEIDLTAYDLPTQSILTMIREVLTMEQPENMEVTVEENTVTASGTTIVAKYVIVFDKGTMAIKSISMPTAEAELVTSDFVFTEKT